MTVGPSGSGPAEPGVRAHGRREGGDGLHARGSMTCGLSLSHACHATSQPSYSVLVNAVTQPSHLHAGLHARIDAVKQRQGAAYMYVASKLF